MLERRSLGGLEIRASRDGDIVKITGYGARFDAWYGVSGFQERVVRGAFRRTLKENPDILCCFNHNPDYLLGRSGNKTATFTEDAQGLHYEAILDGADPHSESVVRKIARGDVSSSSMAFFVKKDEWDKSREPYRRSLLELELVESGPVTMPASPTTSTSIAARKSGALDFEVDLLESALVKKRAGIQLSRSEFDACSRFAAEMRADSIDLVETSLRLRRRWSETLQ